MPWIDLNEDVKPFLRKTTAADDGLLTGYITAGCAAIEEIKGHVDQLPVSGELQCTAIGGHTLVLEESPVLDITAVTVAGGSAVPKADPAAGVDGWRLVGPSGVLHVPHAGRYLVDYTAGRNPVPANIRQAALELVAHLWRSGQLNAGGGRPQAGGTDELIIPGLANALPYRVRELLGLYGQLVRDEVLIG